MNFFYNILLIALSAFISFGCKRTGSDLETIDNATRDANAAYKLNSCGEPAHDENLSHEEVAKKTLENLFKVNGKLVEDTGTTEAIKKSIEANILVDENNSCFDDLTAVSDSDITKSFACSYHENDQDYYVFRQGQIQGNDQAQTVTVKQAIRHSLLRMIYQRFYHNHAEKFDDLLNNAREREELLEKIQSNELLFVETLDSATCNQQTYNFLKDKFPKLHDSFFENY